jgi:UDP-2-acetamido-3-amino-2,3-dideoxy-glucuronate N-acetyltransferase
MTNRFKNWEQPEFDENGVTKYGWKCQHSENLILGKESDIGFGSYINARYGVEIQPMVQIGGGCFIYSEDTIGNKFGKVTIKAGARIGSGTRVMPGVTIGFCAVVGAMSFVTKDVPDYALAYGVPARVHK